MWYNCVYIIQNWKFACTKVTYLLYVFSYQIQSKLDINMSIHEQQAYLLSFLSINICDKILWVSNGIVQTNA